MRPDKDSYYLNIAEAVLERSTCLRRKYGAVIVKNDEIIATGYNGAPRGEANCCEIGYCEREQLQIQHGERYEKCRAVHAEMNAIISAPRHEMIGATLYLAGKEVDRSPIYDAKPCLMCERLIVNAGIKSVVSRKESCMTEPLKPCPFCGGKLSEEDVYFGECSAETYEGIIQKVRHERYIGGAAVYFVHCPHCNAHLGGLHKGDFGSPEEAITVWNTRAYES